MGMLLKRKRNDRAEGVTTLQAVAPQPTHTEVQVEQEKPENKKPSRVDIMKMNVATVRAYAEEQGIEGADAMSGAELKRILVNKMFEESE